MRTLGWALMLAAALPMPAARAQLRLPGVPLPVAPLQSLQRGVTQTDSQALTAPNDVRHLAIVTLIRAHPRAVAADRHGEAVVRDEILAYAPSEAGLAAAHTLGFTVLREHSEAELDWRVVVLKTPERLSMDQALRRLRAADPPGVYDFNHLYLGGAAPAFTAPGAAVAAQLPNQQRAPGAAGADAGMGAVTRAAAAVRVGLIDSGVDLAHRVFLQAITHRWGCEQHAVPAAHGTAVASLLVGQAAEFHGVLSGAELFSADVFCGAPTGGALDALVAAFGWMVREQVAVINVSLVGPDNALLARLVAALTARGYLIVAAVGNDGPAAPPLYPAAYPQVVGVTAVDALHRVLLEAARGTQVMFAAPGADMAAAAPADGYLTVRGTSFASPIVAALLAKRLDAPNVAHAAAAVQSLAREAVDCQPQRVPGERCAAIPAVSGGHALLRSLPRSGSRRGAGR